MKKYFNRCLIGFMFGTLSQVTVANTDLLKLLNLTEGTSPSYGENILVGMVEKTGVKYLKASPNTSGKLKFPVSLASNFEVEFKVLEDYCCTEWFDFFLTADEHKINVTFYGGGSVELKADSQTGGGDASAAFIQKQTNTFRLSVANNIAKLYVNDVFSQKVTLTPNITYTQILMGGIEPADSVSSLTTSGNTGVVNTGDTSTCKGDTSLMSATIAPNLNIHIPNASYQSLGGTMNLSADLQFISSPDGRLLWELTNYGVNQ